MKKSKKGFTLIELLVVVLIIGILAAIAVPKYQAAVLKSRVGAMLPLMASLSQAQELYYTNHGSYTEDISALDVSVPDSCIVNTEDSTDTPSTTYSCGNNFMLSVYNRGTVNLHYCPGHNKNTEDCSDNRTIHITFRPKIWSATNQSGKRYCKAYNNSKVAEAACASLGLELL